MNTPADLGPEYAAADDAGFKARYTARCHCGGVRLEVSDDPVDAKICHCGTCQTIHGAPMQWAAIFEKRHVRLTAGSELLRFYNTETRRAERVQPCKVACGVCGTLIADEGRRMWLAFPEMFDLGSQIPSAFQPSCHIFYGSRTVDVHDTLPKWRGHKGRSERID